MTDLEPEMHVDPWMTIAEFAEEMRVRPVTVRSWIAKGQLKATRAGQRKWLVRRSELERMLEQGDGATALEPPPVPPRVAPLDPEDYPPEVWERMAEEAQTRARERQGQDYAMASYEWEIALEQSRMAPPDARFANRIRHIAQAAASRAAAIIECMEDPSFVWKPMEGDAASAVAGALRDLASAMTDLADAIEQRPVREPLADGAAESPRPPAAHTPSSVQQHEEPVRRPSRQLNATS